MGPKFAWYAARGLVIIKPTLNADDNENSDEDLGPLLLFLQNLVVGASCSRILSSDTVNHE